MKAKIAIVAAPVTHRVVDKSVRQAPAMEARTQLTGPATATTRTSQKIMSRLWSLRSGKSDDGTRAAMAERLKIVCSGMDPRTVVVWVKVFPRDLSFPRGFPCTMAFPAPSRRRPGFAIPFASPLARPWAQSKFGPQSITDLAAKRSGPENRG